MMRVIVVYVSPHPDSEAHEAGFVPWPLSQCLEQRQVHASAQGAVITGMTSEPSCPGWNLASVNEGKLLNLFVPYFSPSVKWG